MVLLHYKLFPDLVAQVRRLTAPRPGPRPAPPVPCRTAGGPRRPEPRRPVLRTPRSTCRVPRR
jgi:hypothetical protein